MKALSVFSFQENHPVEKLETLSTKLTSPATAEK